MSEYTEISRFSRREEMANTISHFIGFLMAIAALVMMLHQSLKQGDTIHLISTAVFGITMVILYLSSSLTHFLKQGKVKNFFFTVDKIAIYLLIAGTYTPFALVTIQGALGWTIFGIEWMGAITGTLLILRNPVNFEKGVNIIAVISYAVMGWLILIAIVPAIRVMPTMGWLLILIGGALYTIGIFFYKKGKFRYHHLVWHLFVMGGSVAHFLSIYFFVLPH